MQRSRRLEVRVTDLEKQDWGNAAGGARKVSQWLRSLANAECERLRRQENEAPPSVPEIGRDASKSGAGGESLSRVALVTVTARPQEMSGTPSHAVTVEQGDPRDVEAGKLPVPEPVEAAAVRSLPPGAVVKVDAGETTEHAVVKAATAECPRWMHHRPGVYCGSCKKVIK